ncbi:MAG: folylpolyglutamate synthase/dihydrofolate synthase family protein [Lachnospiraceae bacterium]|nr:folylpolyglutamate synthase/dihydrofolate synthase family protein [Lachnospiraceae bacterium]
MNAIEYLDNIKKYGSIPGLDSISRLLEKLGNPQEKLRIIHIAGTNGKGSILAMLESVLRRSGYCTGRYHSPVLFDVREAFQVNEQWISSQKLQLHVDKVKKVADDIVRQGFPHPTSFEVETAIAFSYFLEEQVDVVLLETGMGGRLDATNIIKKPLVEVLASISMDHMQFLGNTIEEITNEKAGIIKENTDVVLYPSREEIYRIVRGISDERHAHLTMADRSAVRILSQDLLNQSFSYRSRSGHYYEKITIPLLGDHQIYNAITAIEVLEKLKKYFCMGIFEMEEGLRNARWPGRLEMIARRPYIIRDGAHNEDAARQLAGFLEKNFTNKKIFYIIGVLQDKEYEKILEIMSPFSNDVYTVASTSPRALPADVLAECAKKRYQNVTAADSVKQAVVKAKEKAGKEDLILIFGSLSFMKEIEEMREDGTLSADRNA